mmetsp:Transcript_22165/g.58775  ORF Transcript_22165/g.58775 Transcript_22165/m.58775 type:complete len:136 (+) Transcript_22165:123-530(+)
MGWTRLTKSSRSSRGTRTADPQAPQRLDTLRQVPVVHAVGRASQLADETSAELHSSTCPPLTKLDDVLLRFASASSSFFSLEPSMIESSLQMLAAARKANPGKLMTAHTGEFTIRLRANSSKLAHPKKSPALLLR